MGARVPGTRTRAGYAESVPQAPPPESPRPQTQQAMGRRIRLAAAALIFAEALLAIGYAGYLVVESIADETATPEIGWSIAVLLLACGLLMGFLARGVAVARPWSRAPTVLTQLLLLLAVCGPLVQASRSVVGVPLAAVAVAVLALILTAPR